MADNVTLPGAGTVVASVNVGDVHYQKFVPVDTIGSLLGTASNPLQVGGTINIVKTSYIGGTGAACGTTGTSIAALSTSNWAIIAAEGAALYYTVNGSVAGTLVPGYVPSEAQAVIPVISNLTGIYVVGAGTAAVAHISWYKD